MFCPNCGKNVVSGATFCGACGENLAVQSGESAAPQKTPPVAHPTVPLTTPPVAHPTVPLTTPPVTPSITPPPTSVPFTPPTPMTPPSMTMTEPPKKKKKKKGPVIALCSVLGVLAIAAVVFCVIFLPKLNSPFVQIGLGLIDITTSNDTYDISGTVKADGDSTKVNMSYCIDLKNKTVANDRRFENNRKSVIYVDNTNKILIVEADSGDEDIYTSIQVDNVEYSHESDGYSNYESSSHVFDEYDYFFRLLDAVKDPLKIDKSEIAKIVTDYINKHYDIDIEPEVIEVFMDDLEKYLLDEDWLKENFGLTVSKENGAKVYTFDFKASEALKVLYTDILEPNMSTIENLDIERIDEILEYIDHFDIDDMVSEFVNIDIKVSFSVKSGILFKSSLCGVSYTISAKSSIGVTCKESADFTIKKASKKIDIDVDKYLKMYDEFKAGYEKQKAEEDLRNDNDWYDDDDWYNDNDWYDDNDWSNDNDDYDWDY